MRHMPIASKKIRRQAICSVHSVLYSVLYYIKKHIDENDLFSNYTIQPLLYKLDAIEFHQQPGKAYHLSEVTAKQR